MSTSTPTTLVHISNWTTPEISPKRFATWFFIGEVAGGEAVADGTETDQLHWFRPDDRVRRGESGDIELAPPQYVTLLWLRDYATVADAMRAARRGDAIDFTPRFHFIDGDGAVCVYREDIAYDDRGRLDDAGPRHRLYLRDTGWIYQRDYGARNPKNPQPASPWHATHARATPVRSGGPQVLCVRVTCSVGA